MTGANELPIQPAEGWTAETIVEPLHRAYSAADLDAVAVLLSPDVTWGAPEQKVATCQNRDQVLDWFRKGPNVDSRANVMEMTVAGDQLLVGLAVMPNGQAEGNVPAFERWQILTVASDGIRDIRGYEGRQEASSALLQPL